MTRVLSIEDDPEMQHLIGDVLFRCGYEVHYSWNGRDGYEKILMLRPDLVLLDIMLPLMNGFEVLKKMRETPATRDIPVIIVSAYGSETDALGRSVTNLGVFSYLHKPFRMDDLVSQVKSALSRFPDDSNQGKKARRKEISKGSVRADPESRTVWFDGRLIAILSPKSFDLIERLMRNSGAVSKDHLMKDLDYENCDALKKAVQRLREELGDSHKHRIWTAPEGYELKGAEYQEPHPHGDQVTSGDKKTLESPPVP